jgi:large subunit ribosomal protein L43
MMLCCVTAVTGIPKTIGVKNENAVHIQKVLNRMRTCSGRKVTRFKRPVTTRLPSVQGVWDPEVAYHTMPTQIEQRA